MKIFILAALVATAAAGTTYRTEYPTPAYETYAPQPYSFSWDVKDPESYNSYSHSESSDGNVVAGSYRVTLPDGRTQIVTYRADNNGYTADVKYEGEAKYPEPSYKAYKAPTTPVYKVPAPTPAAYKAPASSAYKASVAWPVPTLYRSN